MSNLTEWLDAFEVTVFEVIASQLADNKRMREQTQGQAQGGGFDIEAFRERLALWKRVRRKFEDRKFTLSPDVQIQNVAPASGGNLVATGPVQVYENLFSRAYLIFTGDQAQMAANFLAFYTNAQVQDPAAYVRTVLVGQGITNSEEFEARKGDLLIANPFSPT